MIELMNLTIDVQPCLPDGTAVVHPFYKDSFLRLSGLTEAEAAISETVYPHANEDFLVPILRTASAGYEREITRFYDVRNTEEYGRAAPEYALLAGAELRRASPLGLKGRGALPFALELAEEPLENGEMVLFCCAELYTPLDRGRGKRREACAFLLRGYDPGASQEGRTFILEHRCHVPKKEVLAAVKREGAAPVCSDGAGTGNRYMETSDLVRPFMDLLRAEEGTHLWMVSQDSGGYSYLHIRKGGKEP